MPSDYILIVVIIWCRGFLHNPWHRPITIYILRNKVLNVIFHSSWYSVLIMGASFCFVNKCVKRSKSLDMTSDAPVQVSHQPVWRQNVVPVSLDGIMRPHRAHPRLSFTCSNGPNLCSPSPVIGFCLFVVARFDSSKSLMARSLIINLSGRNLWRGKYFSICLIDISNSFEPGRHFIFLWNRRQMWWKRFLVPLSVRPGKNLTICDHFGPYKECKRKIVASSLADHLVRFRWGPRWFK